MKGAITMELKGTKTEKNLWTAFAGESQARNKYTYFASVAKKEGYEQIAEIFTKTAENEKEHAKMWFKALGELGDTAQNLQYAADKAAYETAAAQVERNKRLLGRQAISVQEYEISVANYQKAKSAYELSSNNMRDTKLTAPFDGSIEKRLVENYQRVNSGEGIVQLVNTQKLRIKFTVPDDYLYLLRAKDVTFKVVFDTYPDMVFNAQLEEYLDISTAGTGIPVTITIEDPAFNRSLYDVKPGFTCKIKLASDVAPFLEEKLVNIPLSAIFGESENQKTYVWVVKDNKVSKREVTVYSPTGEANALISAGIQPGETIVIAGVHQLVDGQTVKVIN